LGLKVPCLRDERGGEEGNKCISSERGKRAGSLKKKVEEGGDKERDKNAGAAPLKGKRNTSGGGRCPFFR